MEVSQVHNSDKPIFVEIFAGRGTLSRAMVQAGFSVLSVDHENNGAVVPLVMLDLTSSSGVKVRWDILSSPNVAAVHLGLPCGTASLARERPVAKNLVLQGAPNPPPLRSASKPLGLGRPQPFPPSQSGQRKQALRLGNTNFGNLCASEYSLQHRKPS